MKYLFADVPFYEQVWSLENWKEFGFSSYNDAEYWQRSSCGVLCLKMVIDAQLLKRDLQLSPKISEYIRQGVALGAYSDREGWSHEGLVRLVKQFGLAAERKKLTVEDLCRFLAEGWLPIVSIKWAFVSSGSWLERSFFWKKRGGHLALVVGYEKDESELVGFYVHHTSIRKEYNWQYKLIPLKKFQDSFTGRGIVVKVDFSLFNVKHNINTNIRINTNNTNAY